MRHSIFTFASRALAIATASSLLVAGAQAVVIAPTYDATITGDANAAQIESTIQDAINVIQGTYSDAVTVKVKFQEGGGLGGSSTWLFADSYAGFRGALAADAKSALDASAVASLPITNPYLMTNGGEKQVLMTTAGARALGYNTGTTPDGFDCTITLNTSICFFRNNVIGNKYDLQAVAMHEIDEAMGGGGPSSFINTGFASQYVGTTDLFRYTGAGVRSTLAANSVGNYLSFDGGTTDVRNFNNGLGGGDYADWASGGGAHVQDAFATPGTIVNYSAKEVSMMDGIGWDVTPTPEPSTIIACSMGVIALVRRRRKA